MTKQTTPQRDPQELDHTGTLDDLLAEVALTSPLAGYAAVMKADPESAFDHQILAGLVLP